MTKYIIEEDVYALIDDIDEIILSEKDEKWLSFKESQIKYE